MKTRVTYSRTGTRLPDRPEGLPGAGVAGGEHRSCDNHAAAAPQQVQGALRAVPDRPRGMDGGAGHASAPV